MGLAAEYCCSFQLVPGRAFDASSRTAGFTAFAKRGCFREGPDCAGKERPCPASAGLRMERKHGDMLHVASGCTIRCWEPGLPELSSSPAVSCGN